MHPFRRFGTIALLGFVVTGCGGGSLARTAPENDLAQSSAQFRQLPSALDPIGAVKPPKFTDIYNFAAGGPTYPTSGLSADAKGNLYGATCTGGTYNNGAAYVISPKHQATVVYNFPPGSLCATTQYSVTVPGSIVKLVGSTPGGGSGGAGMIYGLAISKKGHVTFSDLYDFQDTPDGSSPVGNLIQDSNGNMYGTTNRGGTFNLGTVFELSPPYGQANEKILYSFAGGSDGAYPAAGLIGLPPPPCCKLFGTTTNGGGASEYCSGGCGTVFELTNTPSGYVESVLSSFKGQQVYNDGAYPVTDLIIDKNLTLYGSTSAGGPADGGTVFQLNRSPSGVYTRVQDAAFSASGSGGADPSCVTMDQNGNLWGTTSTAGGNSQGTIFEMKPPPPSGTWSFSVVHTFAGGNNDGSYPFGGVLIGGKGIVKGGDFVGTTSNGGSHELGMIFEVGAFAKGTTYATCSENGSMSSY